MLYYVGRGSRNYAQQPIPPYRRPYWEFQAILSGRAEPWGTERFRRLPAGTDGGFSTPLLWLFPPRHLHGWHSPAGTGCTVAVFHFDQVPQNVSAYTERCGSIAIALNQETAWDTQELASDVQRSFRESLPGSVLLYDYVRAWLCVLLWRAAPREVGAGYGTAKSQRVHGALAYYREQMHRAVSLEEVARHVACSESHLRRLFHELRGESPKQAFQQEQISRARELLAVSERSAESVAEQCGFSSPQAFSRAFRRRTGQTVRSWRVRQQSG